MTNNNSFEAEKNEQVSRRSFLGKGALSFGRNGVSRKCLRTNQNSGCAKSR
jgi:hypothetical protein